MKRFRPFANHPSPINQKYATFAITKMGFQVKAVWNGKEALDYLTLVHGGKAKRPDIILMDVQMPVIDGYKCTHLLRHHMPYKSLLKDVAIIAMTASAISGDRQKALKAGMDDYVCKPVNRAIIELMITRWTAARRREPSPSDAAFASDCSEYSEHCGNADIPQVAMSDGDFTAGSEDQGDDEDDDFHDNPITPRPLNTNGQHEVSPFDSPGLASRAAVIRQQEGEKEWSSKLQETKMLDAAGGMSAVRQGSADVGAGERLTEANVNRLEDENKVPPK